MFEWLKDVASSVGKFFEMFTNNGATATITAIPILFLLQATVAGVIFHSTLLHNFGIRSGHWYHPIDYVSAPFVHPGLTLWLVVLFLACGVFLVVVNQNEKQQVEIEPVPIQNDTKQEQQKKHLKNDPTGPNENNTQDADVKNTTPKTDQKGEQPSISSKSTGGNSQELPQTKVTKQSQSLGKTYLEVARRLTKKWDQNKAKYRSSVSYFVVALILVGTLLSLDPAQVKTWWSSSSSGALLITLAVGGAVLMAAFLEYFSQRSFVFENVVPAFVVGLMAAAGPFVVIHGDTKWFDLTQYAVPLLCAELLAVFALFASRVGAILLIVVTSLYSCAYVPYILGNHVAESVRDDAAFEVAMVNDKTYGDRISNAKLISTTSSHFFFGKETVGQEQQIAVVPKELVRGLFHELEPRKDEAEVKEEGIVPAMTPIAYDVNLDLSGLTEAQQKEDLGDVKVLLEDISTELDCLITTSREKEVATLEDSTSLLVKAGEKIACAIDEQTAATIKPGKRASKTDDFGKQFAKGYLAYFAGEWDKSERALKRANGIKRDHRIDVLRSIVRHNAKKAKLQSDDPQEEAADEAGPTLEFNEPTRSAIKRLRPGLKTADWRWLETQSKSLSQTDDTALSIDAPR